MSEQMFVRNRGKITGPFSMDELKHLAHRGMFSRMHEVSNDGIRWSRASTMPELFVKPETLVAAEAVLEPINTSSVQSWSNEPPPTSEEQIWYYASGATKTGPVAFSHIRILIRTCELKVGDEVWRQGWPQWQRVGNVPECRSLVPKAESSKHWLFACTAFALALVAIIAFSDFGTALLRATRLDTDHQPTGDSAPALNNGPTPLQIKGQATMAFWNRLRATLQKLSSADGQGSLYDMSDVANELRSLPKLGVDNDAVDVVIETAVVLDKVDAHRARQKNPALLGEAFIRGLLGDPLSVADQLSEDQREVELLAQEIRTRHASVSAQLTHRYSMEFIPPLTQLE